MDDATTKPAKKARPRANRYDGRKSREILLPEQLDAWVTKQMGAKWSRNEVMAQVVELAMGKLSAAAAQEETLAQSLVSMRDDIQTLTKHVTTVLAVLTVDNKIRYASPGSKPPDNFREHKAMVQETVQRIRGDEAQ